MDGAFQTWAPTTMQHARFFVAVGTPSGLVVAWPVFVAAITPLTSTRWPNPTWALSGAPSLTPGTLLFTLEGAVAGLVVHTDGQQAVVPWSVVVSEADRLRAAGVREAGRLDVDVQGLSEALREATGAPHGVVVSWVAPAGPAAGHVKVGDVITTVDGQSMASMADWQPRLARLSAGQAVTLILWRAGASVAVSVTALGDAEPARLPLGLRLRTIPRLGVRLDNVAEGSAGSLAGLRTGDILTRVADLDAPTEAQAQRAFQATTVERPLLVAVTRGDAHFVLAMDRRW